MNPWDDMADIFGCSSDAAEIPECAADNIVIAWPSILHAMQRHFGRVTGLAALDFGCGGELFCRKLHELGNQVTGYEQSAALLAAARANVPPEVQLTVSEAAALDRPAAYDVITAIMVLPFVRDIEPLFARLLAALRPEGLLLTAVFNPRFAAHLARGQVVFSDLDLESGEGLLELKAGVKVPVFIRTEADYREIAARAGWRESYRDLPPFTAEFLATYAMPFPTDYPEFLIQGFCQAPPAQVKQKPIIINSNLEAIMTGK